MGKEKTVFGKDGRKITWKRYEEKEKKLKELEKKKKHLKDEILNDYFSLCKYYQIKKLSIKPKYKKKSSLSKLEKFALNKMEDWDPPDIVEYLEGEESVEGYNQGGFNHVDDFCLRMKHQMKKSTRNILNLLNHRIYNLNYKEYRKKFGSGVF